MQKKTLEILKNFASINAGIMIKSGNVLRTVSVEKNILANATIDEKMPRDFAIYNLNEFLSTLSIFTNPTFEYKDNHILIKSSNCEIKYCYSSPDVVVAASEKDLSIDPKDSVISFDVSKEELDQVIKSASIMQLSDLEISANGLRSFNRKTKSGNEYKSKPSNLKSSTASSYIVPINLLKVMPGNYSVKVSDRFVQFTRDDNSMKYFIAVEAI